MRPHWKIINIVICSFGFSFASTMQFANLSTILQFMGFHDQYLSLIWLIAPLTGIISQPIIGIISDNLETSYGKRLPIFFTSSLLATVALLVLPFYNSVLFVISMILFLEIGTNGNNQLQKVLILELLPKKQHTLAFSLSTAISGIGALLAAIIPFILVKIFNITNLVTHNHLPPPSLQYGFTISAIIYFCFCLWTIIGTKEKNKKFEKKKQTLIMLFHFNNILKRLPRVFWEISIIQFFTWIAVFTVWNYLTLAIAQNIFHLPIHESNNLEVAKSYLSIAILWAGIYYGAFQISSTLFSLFIPILNRFFSMFVIYFISLFIGGISLLFIVVIHNPYIMIVPMLFYGFVWGAVLTCPYDIISNSIPDNYSGLYMGIFNLTVTIPQIVAGLFLGYLLSKVFYDQAINLILIAGICLLLSALIILVVIKLQSK